MKLRVHLRSCHITLRSRWVTRRPRRSSSSWLSSRPCLCSRRWPIRSCICSPLGVSLLLAMVCNAHPIHTFVSICLLTIYVVWRHILVTFSHQWWLPCWCWCILCTRLWRKEVRWVKILSSFLSCCPNLYHSKYTYISISNFVIIIHVCFSILIEVKTNF